MSKPRFLTSTEFQAIRATLRKRLSEALEKDCTDGALPDWGNVDSTDLWELPPVDSKCVVKLSPIVKELIGHRLDPRWIRKGGYPSVAEAVEDILLQLEAHCIASATSNSPMTPQSVVLVP